MRFDINLATEPYEDTRRFYRFWGLLLAAALLLTGVMIWFAVANRRDSQDTALKIRDMRHRIALLDQQRDASEAILNRPENRDVRERSGFLNRIIVRKAFSWTQVFADLEKVMPPRLQVTAIRPDIKDDRLQLEIQVESETREPALELVRRMEQSTTFRQPQVVAESTATANNTTEVKFQIVTRYVPPPVQPAPQPQSVPGGQP
jgi:Tfp pilus assembly protein PilN